MFSDILKKLRNEKGLSQEELASIINVSKSTIGMYEQGNRMPKADATLKKLAEYFNVTIDYLMGFSENRHPTPAITEDYVTFPVLGDIAAGYDNIAIERWDGDTIDIPLSYLKGRPKHDYFVLRVKGDSMYPIYHEDDRVLILKQSTLNYSGQIGAIIYDNDCSTLKKVEYIHGEDWIRLVPINPSYTSKTISGPDLEKCRVIGIPKMLIREINDR